MHWEGEKRRRLRRLEEAIERGEVDGPAIPVLEAINALPDYCTTSSCSGRVIVLHEPEVGDKRRAEFLAKWHEPPVDVDRVREAVRRAPDEGITWLKAQPPLFHVLCRDLEAARRLRAVASEAGFKASSIRSIKDTKVVVEILGSERLETPVKVHGRETVREEAWPHLIGLCNRLLTRGHDRLKRLVRAVKGLKEDGE